MERNTNYKELIWMLAKEAGEIIRSDFSSDLKGRWKEGYTPITETGLRVNYLAAAFLKQYYPDDAVLGERGHSGDGEYLWVSDPIDGTLNFSHGLPICVFALSLVHRGVPVVGAIYDPFLDRFYFAEKGKGATLNDAPIRVTPSTSLIGRTINLTSGHGETLDVGRLYNAIREQEARATVIYSTAYMAALVASGEMAGAIFGGRTANDGAPVKVIVEEAGGKVTDLQGRDQAYDREIFGFIASNGSVHERLVEVVASHALLA